MNKYHLQSQVKSTGTAYLFFFLFGAHFAYLNKWGLQLLFWFTLYGLGIWGLIELFSVGNRVNAHNRPIFQELDKIEKGEKQEEFDQRLAMMNAAKG